MFLYPSFSKTRRLWCYLFSVLIDFRSRPDYPLFSYFNEVVWTQWVFVCMFLYLPRSSRLWKRKAIWRCRLWGGGRGPLDPGLQLGGKALEGVVLFAPHLHQYSSLPISLVCLPLRLVCAVCVVHSFSDNWGSQFDMTVDLLVSFIDRWIYTESTRIVRYRFGLENPSTPMMFPKVGGFTCSIEYYCKILGISLNFLILQ